MAIRDIITLPDPKLRLVSKPIERVDDDLRKLIDDMFETMYAARGIGLAAPQVGRTEMVAVVDVAHDGLGAELAQRLDLAGRTGHACDLVPGVNQQRNQPGADHPARTGEEDPH